MKNKKIHVFTTAILTTIIIGLIASIYHSFFYTQQLNKHQVSVSFLSAEIYHQEKLKAKCQRRQTTSHIYKCSADGYVLPNVLIDKKRLAVLVELSNLKANSDEHLDYAINICDGRVMTTETGKVFCVVYYDQSI